MSTTTRLSSHSPKFPAQYYYALYYDLNVFIIPLKKAAAQEVMSAVRLPLMTLAEMLNIVRPSGLLSPDHLLDAIQTRSESRDMELNYRGMLG